MKRALAEGGPWKQKFDEALVRDPSLLGWRGYRQIGLRRLRQKSKAALPDELVGTVCRLGLARHEHSSKRYHHWFDGDGIVHAFRFGGNGISHLGRFVATENS